MQYTKQQQMSLIKLVVVSEHTLGYLRPEDFDKSTPTVGVLREMITKGARNSTVHQPTLLTYSSDTIRLATKEDFKEYRVHFSDEGFGDKTRYKYAENKVA